MKHTHLLLVAGFALFTILSACAHSPTASPTLIGEWVVTHAKISNQLIPSSDIDSKYTLTINKDGSISGLSSCNRWHSSYEIDNNKLSLAAVASTRKRCHFSNNNQKLMTDKFPNLLKVPATIKVVDDTLTLSWSDNEFWRFKPKG